MRKSIALFSLFVSFLATAQDFAAVDARVTAYPSQFESPEKLADRIKGDFTADADKARAIFTWIAMNVTYDLAQFRDIREGGGQVAFSYKTEEERDRKLREFRYGLALKALKKRKGVCEHYAALFHVLCDFTGLPVQDIPGTSKTNISQIGQLPGANDHIWNAVKIAGQWKLVDVTWASGSVDGKTGKFASRFNDGWFGTDPKVFALSHFPKDKRQAMTAVSEEEFASNPIFYGSYVKAGLELVAPYDGILEITGPVVVPFEIRNLPEGAHIGYVLSHDNILRPVAVSREGGVSRFEVAIDKPNRGYLYITLDGKSLIAYKLAKGGT